MKINTYSLWWLCVNGFVFWLEALSSADARSVPSEVDDGTLASEIVVTISQVRGLRPKHQKASKKSNSEHTAKDKNAKQAKKGKKVKASSNNREPAAAPNGGCNTNPPSCANIGRLCTNEAAVCDQATSFEWICRSNPVVCQEDGNSCDPQDGQCKEDDQLVPCVAVVDKGNPVWGIMPLERQWTQFRAEYPDRPFCLLIYGPESQANIPDNFRNDSLKLVAANLLADGEQRDKLLDWASLCGLDHPQSFNVNVIAFFNDDLYTGDFYAAKASQDYFKAKMESNGIKAIKALSSLESWISPFKRAFVTN